MKKNNLIYLFILALTVFLYTCKDPVFYAISQEVKPIEPLINGVPTNFAVFNNSMYVASGYFLFAYNKGPSPDSPYWSCETPPIGNILQLASTGDYLYALCLLVQGNNGITVLNRLDKVNSSWSQVGGNLNNYSYIHNIFAAGGVLFILTTSALTTPNNMYYTVQYIDNNNPDTINLLKNASSDQQADAGEITSEDWNENDMGEITGAVWNEKEQKYYLSSKYKGVYRIDDIAKGAILINKDYFGNYVYESFMGIINLEDDDNTIMLISRNGNAFTVKDFISPFENVFMGKMATGALAVWTNPEKEDERLLLSGRQDSLSYSSTYGYKYGYLELDISGVKIGSNFIEPGWVLPSTVLMGDNERFQSTLGKYPVNHLFQVPAEIDSNMILFASTQKNGVWSYRNRGGLFQWNAE